MAQWEGAREYKRALIFIKSGDLERAQEVLEELVSRSPGSVKASNKLAFVLIERGKPERASEILQGVRSRGQQDFYTHYLTGRVHITAKMTREAIAEFTTALSLNPRDVYTLNGIAQALLVEGDAERAEKFLRKAIEINAKDPTAYVSLANILLSRKRTDEALGIVREGLSGCERDASLTFLEGRISLQNSDLPHAAARFDEILRWYPQSPLGHLGRGWVHEKEGDLSQAIQMLERAAQLEPGHSITWAELGRIRLQRGEAADSMIAYEKATAIEPDSCDHASGLAQACYHRGHIIRAWRGAEQVLARYPDHRQTRLLKALISLDEDWLDQAARIFEELLLVDRDNRLATLALAEIRAQRKDLDSAEDQAQEFLSRDPGCLQALLVLSLVGLSRGHRE